MQIEPLSGGLGANVRALDLDSAIDDDVFDTLYAAFLEHQLLVFPNRRVAPASQVTFARRFGEVQKHVMSQYHVDGIPELYLLSNVGADNLPSGQHPDQGTLAWHTDASWQQRTSLATFMFAVEIPQHGGQTHFADMYGAYQRLDDEDRALADRAQVQHNLDFSRNRRHAHEPMTDQQRAAAPPSRHPMVRVHPDTGRKALYLGDHAECVLGMDYGESRKLIDRLNAQAVRRTAIYRHVWEPDQLVVWDNRCLLHRATEYDTRNERRIIRRCTVLMPA